jgi:hypothetical protein
LHSQNISDAKKGIPQPWAKENGERLKGIVRSEEFKENVSSGMKSYVATLPPGEMARRASMRKNKVNGPMSEETKKKISEAHKKRNYSSEEMSRRAKLNPSCYKKKEPANDL